MTNPPSTSASVDGIEPVVIDLDRAFWDSLVKAVGESNWIPPEYFANDWVSDCCDFLRNGPPSDGIEPSGWRDIATAPKDGTRFIGRGAVVDRRTGKLRHYLKRKTWFGKASHVPLYGWCHGRHVENIDLWQPTHWRAL